MRRTLPILLAACLLYAHDAHCAEPTATAPIRPGDPRWPRVWTTYDKIDTLDSDIKQLQAGGVGLISRGARNAAEARAALEVARRTGMKFHIEFPEVTEDAGVIKRHGLAPVPAVMIGGVCQGKAIDRHLFSFTAGRHEVLIEPPVYNKAFAYTRGAGATGDAKPGEKFGHYFPEMGPPLRAEVVVPLKLFDGRQHVKIVPATLREAPADARPAVDSVTPDMPPSSETGNRKLYRLSFDLSGLEGALLDRVGLAVYWQYGGYPHYWMFGRGTQSAWAQCTQDALRAEVRKILAVWSEANGGTFPADVVLAARFGDECFYTTGHVRGPAVNYPLWDYSEPGVAAFRGRAGDLEYPRTWGFPEIYGREAYAWWLYTLHEGCARLCGAVREEIARSAPGLLLFRNTTRAGVFDLSNDHDGSGQELLTRNLDIVHLDPYPVSAGGYGMVIPRDMAYCGGLARRYHRPLVPWMQAHTYAAGGLTHVGPDDVQRMAREQWAQGVDAIMWLGWGPRFTFPNARPESWQQAVEFHKRLSATAPPKPNARLAVLRPYTVWAVSSAWETQIRNPADWLLRQFLEVWAVRHGQAYDVFELAPAMGPQERDAIEAELKQYPRIVSTEPRADAWVIGAGTEGTPIDPATETEVCRRFEAEMQARGWLPVGDINVEAKHGLSPER